MENLPRIKDVVDYMKMSPTLQSSGELRFGNNCSLSVDTENNRFYDHENEKGGGVFDFIVYKGEAEDRRAAAIWCREHGLIADEPSSRVPIREHVYVDPDGNPVSKAIKFRSGTWSQMRAENGVWLYGIKGVRRYPYGVDRLLKEDKSRQLFIMEGEKDVERAWQHGLSATCNIGGAGKWQDEFNQYIVNRSVCVVPDNDKAGANHATKVAASLQRSQIDCFILDYASALPEKADFSDWMDANDNDASRFVKLAQAAQALPREPVEPSKRILTMISDIEIKDPEYLIDETIETKSLAALVGPSGSGKTFVAIDMAMSIATGTPYHGNQVQKGLVIMSAGEGHSGIPRRIDAWLAHHSQDICNAALALTSRAVDLFDTEYHSAFCSEIDAIAEEKGAPKLIIIDTVARHMSGLDENATKDMGALIAIADKLKDQYSCVVLLVHHTGHANPDRARGSTAFKGALDTEILVKPIGDNDITTSCEKQKDGAPFSMRQFVKVSVGQSLILQQVETTAKHRRKITSAEQYALDSLSGTFKEIGRTTAHVDEWRPNFYAGHTADTDDAKRKAFTRVRQALIKKGFIACHEDKYTLRDMRDMSGTSGKCPTRTNPK